MKAGGSFSTGTGLDRALESYDIPARIVSKIGLKLKKEVVSGFASTLTFGCSKGHETEFQTSREIITGVSDRGRKPEINLRLALAFMNLGKGATHLYRLAAHLNMNIPTNYLDGKNFSGCEKTLGPHIEAAAKQTCRDALAAAIAAEESKEGATPTTTYQGNVLVHIPVSVDMGWVKRSSGNAYDSDSGVATAIEQTNGKIVEFEIKAKFCKMCELQKAKQSAITPTDFAEFKKAHDCKENWNGLSSKSMEAGAVVAMALRAPERGVKFTPITSDDDSSMRAWMQAIDTTDDKHKGKMPPELAVYKFCADPSHRTKVFARHLYAMACKPAKDKPGSNEEGSSKMNKEVAAKLKQYHAYILAQHRDKLPRELQVALLNMVEHAFNVHDDCGDWCPAKQARALGKEYDPPGFVRNEYLHGAALKAAILEIVVRFSDIETCEQSTHPYHSQGNEAFNRRASSKAPKDVCYGRTGGYTRRISLAVGEHNVGVVNNYTILEQLEIVPGVHMKRLLEHYQQKVDRKVLQSKSLEGKQVRKFKSGARITQSRKENPSNAADYGSGMGFGMGRASAPFVDPKARQRNQKRTRVTRTGTKGKNRAVGPSSDGDPEVIDDSDSEANATMDADKQMDAAGLPAESDSESEDEPEEVLTRTSRREKRVPTWLDE